jgi:hypothetical protein
MLRRAFLAAPLAAAGFTEIGNLAKSGRSPRRPDRSRGVVVLVCIPSIWSPRSWRDTPPAGAEIVSVDPPQSLASARKFVKWANLEAMRTGDCLWRVVVVTDGRKARGGAA